MKKLTIYLLRNSVKQAKEALAEGKNPNTTALIADAGFQGTFFHVNRAESNPALLGFLTPILASKPTLTSSSASGLLVLKSGNRHFAVTFGYGRSLLDLSKVEENFGVKVVLNIVDPAQIRSIDTKTFEDLVVARNVQTSKSSDLPTFGIDVLRDILRAVTGEPLDQKEYGTRVAGSDSLVVNKDLEASQVGAFCEVALKAYKQERYQKDFAWIDHLAVVSDA